MRAPDFWDRKTSGLLPTILRPLGWATAGLAALRQRRGTPYKAPVPVICVGNLVAGGAGKTPVALDLLQRLQARGVKAHAVVRGYGGHESGPLKVDPDTHSSAEVGDEALLLVEQAPTWVSRKRKLGVQAAVQDGAEVVVLDDGFQNPTVHKDLSLLVVDGNYGFGNGRVMPAGPLREPVPAGLARADAVVLLGTDEADVWGRVRREGFRDLPIIRGRIQPGADAQTLSGCKVYAFAGIGRPQKFFDTLTGLGCRLVGCKAFADHHPYSRAEIDAILNEANDNIVVTTTKDYVRLTARYKKRIHTLPVELVWKNPDEIDALLEQTLKAHAHV